MNNEKEGKILIREPIPTKWVLSAQDPVDLCFRIWAPDGETFQQDQTIHTAVLVGKEGQPLDYFRPGANIPRFTFQGAGKIDFDDKSRRSEGTFHLYNCRFERQDGDTLLLTGTLDVLVAVHCFVLSDAGETFDYMARQLLEVITVTEWQLHDDVVRILVWEDQLSFYLFIYLFILFPQFLLNIHCTSQ